MKTEVITDQIETAVELLRSGELVAVPTETVYGLAGNGLNPDAVAEIYRVKRRPEIKALSLMVPDRAAIDRYCINVPAVAYAFAEKFWPGPLTLVLESKSDIPEITRAGGKTVGLRCPDHPMTLALLKACQLPLAAPSANPSGADSPKTAEQVLGYFEGEIAAVMDGGACGIGTESTILDLSQTPYQILRQGALRKEKIFDTLMKSVRLVGITGGSGGGKTTTLRVLESMGALILDCDEIYHDLTVSSAPMRAELTARFGDVYDGEILNRKKLGAMVFSDPEALSELNAITHKYVSEALDKALLEHARNGGTLAAIDAIGLLDIPHAKRTVVNVAVTAPVEMRVQRLMLREGITEAYARQRIAAQKSDAYFAEHCDAVLENNGTKEEFEQKCMKYFTEVLNYVREER